MDGQGKHAGYGNGGRARVGHWGRVSEGGESLSDIFLLLRGNPEPFFKFLSFVSMGGRKCDGEIDRR